MAQGSARRTPGAPYGNEALDFASMANAIVCRVSLLLIVVLARCLMFAIEQPSSTALHVHYSVYGVCQIHCDSAGAAFPRGVAAGIGCKGNF